MIKKERAKVLIKYTFTDGILAAYWSKHILGLLVFSPSEGQLRVVPPHSDGSRVGLKKISCFKMYKFAHGMRMDEYQLLIGRISNIEF